MLVMLIGAILLSVLVVGVLIGLNWQGQQFISDPVSAPQAVDHQLSVDSQVTITSPAEGATISGLFTIEGTASGDVNEIELNLTAADGQQLGVRTVSIADLPDSDTKRWQIDMQVVGNITSETAILRAGSGEVTASHEVRFPVVQLEERLQLKTPIADQSVPRDIINLSGQMQGFFEGTMQVRVIAGTDVLLETFVQATGDNYTDFAPFAKQLSLPADFEEDEVVLQLYEINMRNGAEEILLEIPLSVYLPT